MRSKVLMFGGLSLACAWGAGATTLVRGNLDRLVADHSTVVVGEVLSADSRWNEDGSFIVTDVRLLVDETVKGAQRDFLTVTVLGGTVGDLTTVIVGGAELVPGRSYLLFLSPGTLAGAERELTVREHVQGAFDLDEEGGRWVARSQARSHRLLADERGLSNPVGGSDGVPLARLLDAIRVLDRQPAGRREVK